jgi:hypothetical protein
MRDYRCVKEYEEMWGVTWDELVALEPELNRLLAEAQGAGYGCRTLGQVNRRFTPFKNDIARLVGFCGKYRGHPVLGTHKAYDVVYWKLRNAVARDPRDA